MQLWRGVTRHGGGQFLCVNGLHKRMFSARGTNNYNADYNYKPPEHYNEEYCYKPRPHYNEDYNNSKDEYSARPERHFNNIAEKHTPTKMEYDFEKLEYRIFRMEHDFERHYENLHRALQESVNEIRDERKNVVLDINMEKLSNEMNWIIYSTMNKLTNDLIQVCTKYVVKPKAAVDDHHDPVEVCAENMEQSKAAVDGHYHDRSG
ncbi:hypothetical protein FNV43_RR26246 [Rhamnella rubrinervis]|uniref:Uncharacterized protein n=1 Tax=Rhamnella rubrinervis TaxID=2594499 RepID=A0A8K0GRA9_9ROSA|nr:hypothetical protein FNV43_RR26246 [Rhamnella rubrinervis]